MEKNYNKSEIHSDMCQTIGDDVISLRTVGTLYDRFSSGNTDVVEMKRVGRPIDQKLRVLVELELKTDKFLSGRAIGRQLSCDDKTVTSILRNELKMRKINSKWIPHQLTLEQKKTRVLLSRSLLQTLSSLSDDDVLITLDETWIPWSNNFKFMWCVNGENLLSVLRKR